MAKRHFRSRAGFRILSAWIVAGLAACFAFVAAPAANAGSFCYESASITKTGSYVTGVVTVNASVTYRDLRSCAGTTIGIHWINSTMSYSGGFNGTGDYGSRHGIIRGGVVFVRAASIAGDEIWAGSTFPLDYVRTYTDNANRYIYSGYSVHDHVYYSFSEAGIGADLERVWNRGPILISQRVTFQPVSRSWLATPAI